jgi:CheY-like chemotaxis protein
MKARTGTAVCAKGDCNGAVNDSDHRNSRHHPVPVPESCRPGIVPQAAGDQKRAEREEALAESLRLDFTRESKTLKRVEVKDPVARILCVDDEEVILDSLRKILVLDGYSIDTVETGQEALGLVQTRDYDFVFTDLKMPAMSGTDVAKSVKHLRPDIDVVIITGYATVESAVECMKHGAMDYIEKPFTEDELRQFVKHALIRRQDRIEKQLKPRVNVIGPAEAERQPPENSPSPAASWSPRATAGRASRRTAPRRSASTISPGSCWAGSMASNCRRSG